MKKTVMINNSRSKLPRAQVNTVQFFDTKLSDKDLLQLKSVHFGHVHSELFGLANARVHGKGLSLSYHSIVVFEHLSPFIKSSFSSKVFHEIIPITDALRKNAHDQNEQTIKIYTPFNAEKLGQLQKKRFQLKV